VQLITTLLLPGTAAQSARNLAKPAVTVISPTLSSKVERFTISVNIFGNTVTLIDMTAAQSEQIEKATEAAECSYEYNAVACANLLLTVAQMRTGGVVSELLRLTKVAGNSVLCLGFVEKSACFSLSQEVLREIIFGPPPTITTEPSTGSNQPTTPTSIPGIDPFVGTWWIGGGAITLTIKSDGSATYGAMGPGTSSQIQFTNVSGDIATGTVVSGADIPTGPQGNSIPVGGTITATLIDQHTLQISNGYVLCPNTEQCAN
jgi:hypothetical protein